MAQRRVKPKSLQVVAQPVLRLWRRSSLGICASAQTDAEGSAATAQTGRRILNGPRRRGLRGVPVAGREY